MAMSPTRLQKLDKDKEASAVLIWETAVGSHRMILIKVLFFTLHYSAVVRGSKETVVTEYGKDCSEKESCLSFCPVVWERKGQHCFFWSQDFDYETTTWEHAEDYCRDFDAHLAAATTSDVYEYMRSKISSDTWIGATNQTKSGTWVWTDCSSFNSQPPTGSGSCAHLTVDGQGSNGKKCGNKLKFVCSKTLCPGESRKISKAHMYNILGEGSVTLAENNKANGMSRSPRMKGE